MKTGCLLCAVILMIFHGCTPDNRNYKFEYQTIVTDIPVNLEKLNTEYDDYNSDLPYPAARMDICFSTSRRSMGSDFDLIFKNIDISYHVKDDILNMTIYENDDLSQYQNSLGGLVNSGSDQLGPYTLNGSSGWDYFFYADNESGDFDINLVHTRRLDWGTYNGKKELFGPSGLTWINSEYDDLYPTVNNESTRIFFCSNRDDNEFDIYSAEVKNDLLLHEYMTTTASQAIIKEEVLSGDGNDKCPSIAKNLLVFTSDRAGGYGGYDLYYSLFENGGWSEPVNFGAKINSSGNEYRPITFTFNNIDLMIFSSDRPGGKGGYDLYCVKTGDLIR